MGLAPKPCERFPSPCTCFRGFGACPTFRRPVPAFRSSFHFEYGHHLQKILSGFNMELAMPRFTLAILLLISNPCGAHHPGWPQKTGPTSNGMARDIEAKGLPIEWNEEPGKNIAWKIELSGIGHSTPVVGDERVWFTSATEDGKRQYVYCADAESGETLHHKLLFENPEPEPLGNPVNSYASPTCFLTHEAVYVHFGTYGTAKLDTKTADVIWQRRDINCRHFRGPGSSPIRFRNTIVLTFDGIDQQFLTALDAKTGDTIWRTDRTTDYDDLDENGKPHRDGDLRKAYSTPAIFSAGDRHQIVSVGSRAAFGYDAVTGKELWTITHDDYNAAAQPLIFNDTAIINTGSRGADLLAVRIGESTLGDVTSSHVVWNREKGNSRLCFPALFEGSIYSLTDNGVLTCIDAGTGKEKWTGRVGGNFVASPVVANRLVYMSDEQGRTTVCRTGDHFEIVARNQLAEGGKASPAIAGGAIYLRTKSQLYKIAKD